MPEAIAKQSKPSVSRSVGELREGASKLADGATGLLIALFVILLGLLSEEDPDEVAEGEKVAINPDDPFWSSPPIPESEWKEGTEGVSSDTDAYLYSSSKSE